MTRAFTQHVNLRSFHVFLSPPQDALSPILSTTQSTAGKGRSLITCSVRPHFRAGGVALCLSRSRVCGPYTRRQWQGDDHKEGADKARKRQRSRNMVSHGLVLSCHYHPELSSHQVAVGSLSWQNKKETPDMHLRIPISRRRSCAVQNTLLHVPIGQVV